MSKSAPPFAVIYPLPSHLASRIQEKGKASTKELEKVLGKSKATIKRKIKTLTEKGYLVWKGKSKKDQSGYYELTGSTMIQVRASMSQ